MLVSQLCNHAPTGGALDETFHNEIWLIHFFYRACILANGSSYRGDAHRTALELVDNSQQYLVVYLVKAILVYIQGCKGYMRNLCIYAPGTLYLCKIAHAAQQGIGYTRRTATAASSSIGTFKILAERFKMRTNVSGS